MTIFVFGSNWQGAHGAGSARAARERWGAKLGVGEGRTGNAYAIPTKETPYKRRSLADVKASVERFLGYAREHSDLDFLIVRVGCNLAGFTDREMATLFAAAPDNCSFNPLWGKFGLKPWRFFPDASTKGVRR